MKRRSCRELLRYNVKGATAVRIVLALLTTIAYSLSVVDAQATIVDVGNAALSDLGAGAPIAVTDTATTLEYTPATIAVLYNDIPADYPLVSDSVAISVYPDHGSVVWFVPGVVRYTPIGGFIGLDQFEYIVCDSQGLCAYANVYVTVTPIDDPIAVTDTATTTESAPTDIAVLYNDIPADYPLVSDSVAVSVYPQHGGVNWIVPGVITYAPDAQFVGYDWFEYVVCDSLGQCTYGNVVVAVTEGTYVEAIDDYVAMTENIQASWNILANDIPGAYPIAPELTTISRSPLVGVTEVSVDGTITYTPPPNTSGWIAIEYIACDHYSHCDAADILVEIADSASVNPQTSPDFVTVDEKASTPIEVLVNDLPGDYAIEPSSFALAWLPRSGSAAVTGPGVITYTPLSDFVGSNLMIYMVCDSVGNCSTDRVFIEVADVQDPVAVTDTVLANERASTRIAVLANDLPGPYPLVGGSVGVQVLPDHGTVVVSATGEITYTPQPGYVGGDSFEYIVCDSIGQCAYAPVFVSVVPVDDPVAITDSAIVVQEDAVGVKVLYNDIAGGYPLVSDSVAVSAFPSHGSVDWTIPGEITYTPSPGYVGGDSFEYIVCDSIGQCAYAPVLVTVTASSGPTLIAGQVTNGGNARVSVFSASTGSQVSTAYMSNGNFTVEVPQSTCPDGFKIYLGAPKGFVPQWYRNASNFTAADCASGPSVLDPVTLEVATNITGSVKDMATLTPLDGSIVYAFTASDGRFVGWARVGATSPGTYSIPVRAGEPYKLKVQPPPGYLGQWNGGASSFVTADPITPPASVDFLVRSTGSITGGVKRGDGNPVNGAHVYAWDATSGSFAGSASTGGAADGEFALNLDPSRTYKVKIGGPPDLEDIWYPSAPGWVEAIGVAPPFSIDVTLRGAVNITGVAAMPNQPTLVSAYTACGCTSPTNTISDIYGNYSLKVVSTADSGDQYRVRAIDSTGSTVWFNGSTGFTGSTPVSAPASEIDMTR